MMQRKIAGLVPWLPWPLCRWRLWTEPVRAERLAALRIGLAFFILLDILTTYGPHVHDLYGPDSLSRVGERDVFWYVGRGGNYAGDSRDMASWYWSLWRGFNHSLTLGFALTATVVLTFWIIFRLTERRSPAPQTPAYDGRGAPVSWSWLIGGWMAAAIVALLGMWRSATTLPESVSVDLETALQLGAAVVMLLVASLLVIVAKVYRPDPDDRPKRLLQAAWILSAVFVLVAAWQFITDWLEWDDFALDLDWLLVPWHLNPMALQIGVIVLGLTTCLLLIGCWTRLSAVLTWILLLSFDNLNHYSLDSGETVRYILFFYLLLTPCGAVWSVDSWLRRRRDHDARPVYVAPWPLRLMFVQLLFIYCFNGLYKLSGDTWFEGTSLYRVLSSLEIARFSITLLPVNYTLLQISTWVVLAWETTFPLLVLFRWTRVPALIMGATFHLGIFLTMEIGFFGAYMLCFYLPMLPWERWSRRREPVSAAPPPRESSPMRSSPLSASGQIKAQAT